MNLSALNIALVVGNLYFLWRVRAKLHKLSAVAADFSRRVTSGHVLVVGADSGRIGKLCVASVGDDALCLSIEPLDAPPVDLEYCPSCGAPVAFQADTAVH